MRDIVRHRLNSLAPAPYFRRAADDLHRDVAGGFVINAGYSIYLLFKNKTLATKVSQPLFDFAVGHFYEGVGALRDVMQNHLLQIVALLGMEPPVGASADAHGRCVLRFRHIDHSLSCFGN